MMSVPMATCTVTGICSRHAVADTLICVYPNAGLPNPLAPTGFDLEPYHMEKFMADFADAGLLNLAGGCCGNTPEHIAAIAKGLAGKKPREVPVMNQTFSVIAGSMPSGG